MMLISSRGKVCSMIHYMDGVVTLRMAQPFPMSKVLYKFKHAYACPVGLKICLHFHLDILHRISFNWAKIVNRIRVYNTNEEMITIYSADINWGLTPEFPSCKTIDILNYFNFKVAPARQIFFQFEKVKDLSVALYVEDRNKALKRPLKVCRTGKWLYRW